jgi:hypothetical protein
MQHGFKTDECHDVLDHETLKMEYPEEYNRQVRELAKNKKKPMSGLVDLLLKPLKEFEELKGTGFTKYDEPFYWNDFWEIWKHRNPVESWDSDDEEMESGEDDVAVEKEAEDVPQEDEQVAMEETAKIAALGRELTEQGSQMTSESVEDEVAPPKRKRESIRRVSDEAERRASEEAECSKGVNPLPHDYYKGYNDDEIKHNSEGRASTMIPCLPLQGTNDTAGFLDRMYRYNDPKAILHQHGGRGFFAGASFYEKQKRLDAQGFHSKLLYFSIH